jgi:hypothetical protein
MVSERRETSGITSGGQKKVDELAAEEVNVLIE